MQRLTLFRKRLGLLGALILTASLVLAACGGNTSDAGGSILADVLDRGSVRVATITGNPPFEFLDDGGNLVGYDIDVVNELASRMGVDVEFTETDVAGRVTVLETGKADIVVSTFTRTPERAQVVAFTDPINLEFVQLLASADASGSAVEDFNNSSMRIAVATGGTQVDAVAAALPNATAVQVPSMADEISAVVSGQADAAAVANTQVGDLMSANPGQFKVVEGALSAPQEDCLGLPIGDFTWWLYVNQIIHDMNEDGTTYSLYQKWFGEGVTPGPFSKPPAGA